MILKLLKDRLLVFSVRFTPRFLVTAISRKLSESR